MSLLLQGQIPPALANGVRVMAVAGLVGLAVLIAAPFQERRILRTFGWLPLPGKISQSISQQAVPLLVGMHSLQNAPRMLAFLVLTAVVWLGDALGSSVGARIISQTLSLGQAMVLLAALGLSSAIPSTPGYVGVNQFVAVKVVPAFSSSRGETLAYILIGQVLNYLVVSFWGLGCGRRIEARRGREVRTDWLDETRGLFAGSFWSQAFMKCWTLARTPI